MYARGGPAEFARSFDVCDTQSATSYAISEITPILDAKIFWTALPVLFAGGGVDDGVGAAVPHGGGAHRAGVGQDVDVVAAQVLAEAAVRQVEVGGRAPLPQLVGGLADRHHLGVGRRVTRLGHLKEVNDLDSFMIG